MLINYKDVNVYQDDVCVLNEVNLQVNEGEFIYLIGRVGSGKTSLLKTFYKEIDILEGEAEVLGYNLKSMRNRQVQELRRKIGIVFQDFQLLTDRSVFQNLDFVLRATDWKDKKKRAQRVDEVLRLVGMEDKAQKMPKELSGGEQQRVVIARAILNNPTLILADEPTGNLDNETGHQIVELLRKISEQGSSVIMSTHNLQILREYPQKVYRCEKHHFAEITNDFNLNQEMEEATDQTVDETTN